MLLVIIVLSNILDVSSMSYILYLAINITSIQRVSSWKSRMDIKASLCKYQIIHQYEYIRKLKHT